MKKKIIYLTAVLIPALFGCSEDFLDRKPLDEQVSSNFYFTETDATQALVSVYDVLGYQSVKAWAPFQMISDILSDDAFGGGSDANEGELAIEINDFTLQTTNTMVHSIWARNYIGIYRANLLLERIDDIDASDEFKARVIAECKFLRAYFHFELVRFYENVPLLTATIKGPSEYSQTQNTPEEVYNQVAMDLVEAIPELPETLPSQEQGRITKWAAESLLARAYLFYNDVYSNDLVAGSVTVNRAKAIEYLEDVIDNSGHDLLTIYSDNFRAAYEFSEESVFEISHGDSPPWWDWEYTIGGEGNLAAQMQGPRVTGSMNWNRGWSYAPVTQSLAIAMTGDPRFSATILLESDLDGDLVKGYQHTGYYSRKYTSDAEHWGADGQFELNRTCNYRVIRFSDVLLMAAELGSTNAQTYLDRVRARVGLPSVPVTLDNIYNERRLELALEGIRYFDIVRRGMSYASQELTMQGERGPDYEGDQAIFDVTFDPATKGFLPIPQVEVDLSGGKFNQNEGY
ncbi:MAG: RagB/SusD family nutrient uptake outer membrane protein [Bacteroidales bacterium]|nr:RagB/SusD family nutrient uptake outer membrane protein [Bacteroidales bacterium]